MTYDKQLKAAREKKEQTAEESDFLPQYKKLKIDASAATPAGPAFTQQLPTLVPLPGTTVFQTVCFMGAV